MAKVLVTESNLEDIGDAIRDRLQVSTTYLPSEMGDAVRSIPVIDIDTTLTRSGYAADAKVVGDKFDDLIDPALHLSGKAADAKATGEAIADAEKSVEDVTDILGVSLIDGFTGGKYIQTNGDVGSTVAINSPQTSSNFAYKIIPCVVGDKITLNATGGNAGRLWAFIDSSNALLSKADANAVASNLILTAPANAAKCVINMNVNSAIGANYIDVGTSMKAELADIRVGANGTTYATAGGAVRGQVGELRGSLDLMLNKNNLFVGASFVNNAYYAGAEYSSTHHGYYRINLIANTQYTFMGVRFISTASELLENIQSSEYRHTYTPINSGMYYITITTDDPIHFFVTTINYNNGRYGTNEQPYFADYLILQDTGDSKVACMSQYAVTNSLNRIVTHPNLANPTEFTENSYMGNDGTAGSSSSYFYTGFIDVDGVDNLSFTNARFLTAYDENKNVLTDKGISSESIMAKSYVVPDGVKFVIITGETVNQSSFVVNAEMFLYPFVPYSVEEINPHYASSKKTNIAFSNCGASACIENASTLNSGSAVFLYDVPQNLKNGVILTAYCEFSSFDSIVIGKGYNSYRGDWFSIDSTSVKHYHYENSAQIVSEQNHSIVISDYIDAVIDIKPNGKAFVNINSTSGTSTLEFTLTHEQNGIPFMYGRQTINNVRFNAVSTMAKCPLWIIGDSYCGYDTDRVMGQLEALGGYTQHILVDGLAGQGSSGAWRELTSLIVNGNTPKYLVWYIGMNDTDAVYSEYLEKVADICAKKGIVLIINDVPTVPNVNNESKHTLVLTYKNKGYRIVSSYEAVGASSSGTWRAGYLSGDNVHPSVIGAKALAMALLVSVPEIAQYN